MTNLLKRYKETKDSVFSVMGIPHYYFQYADDYGLLVMINSSNGMLVDKEKAGEIIIELQRYIDNFPNELITLNREHINKKMGNK